MIPSGDSVIVDFSDCNNKWKYLQFVCDICNKECNTKRILNNHHKKDHKGKENMSDESEDVSLKKVRMEEEVKCVTEEE